jgi:hypothetical protein
MRAVTAKIAFVVCLACVAAAANAQPFPGCDLPPGFERAERPRLSISSSEPGPGPQIRVESLRRGFDDGNQRSCSNIGVLTLVLDPQTMTETEVYSFEVAQGRLPQGLLPGGYVESVDLGSGQRGFRFYWPDLRAGDDELAPIGAVVRINRTFYDGTRSEPMVLDIFDAGGAPETTSNIWNSTVVWIVVAALLLAIVSLRMKAFRRSGRRQDELADIQSRLRQLAAENTASRAKPTDNSE